MKAVARNTRITTDPPANFGLDLDVFPNGEGRRPLLLMCGRIVITESTPTPRYVSDGNYDTILPAVYDERTNRFLPERRAVWSKSPTNRGDAILDRAPEYHYCNRPLASHPYVSRGNEFVVTCDRTDTTPEVTDFYLTYNDAVIPYQEFSGNEAKIDSLVNRTWDEDLNGSIIDENHYVSPTIEWNALDRWRDISPEVCTVTLEQHQTGLANEAQMVKGQFLPLKDFFEPQLRNAYVEGQEGFTARELYSLESTKNYLNHLLNVFADKEGNFRVGSCKITKTVDARLVAECVKCGATTPAIGNEASLDDKQTFVYALIRHGNNHAHSFIRNRPTWYKLHDENCDLNCNPRESYCFPASVAPRLQPELDEVQYLFEHQARCTNPKCACTDILKELVPALT